MSDHLPAPPGDPRVILEALAKAAAEYAAQRAIARPHVIPLSREEITELVDDAIRDAFLRVHVDLEKQESIAAFVATLAYAERARRTWASAGSTIVTGIVSALVLAVLGLMSKVGVGPFLSGGGK